VVKIQLPSSITVSDEGVLAISPQGKIDPKKIRDMRRDPTIFLARLMVRAAIISTGWSTEMNDAADEAIKLEVDKFAQPLRHKYLDDATRGIIDYGWQAFEKLSRIVAGQYTIVGLKPLLQDISELLVDDDGAFSGIKQDDVELNKFDCMLTNNDAECGYLYGSSYMGNVEKAYDTSVRVSAVADVYDKKIAGAHWIIYFPDGVSLFNGTEKSNDLIAKELINKLENSGSMAIPYKTTEIINNLNSQAGKPAWIIELKEASGSGANFNERLVRCDKEKVRGFGLPERSVLEGQYGTKADAGAHGDFALTGVELLHKAIVAAFNVQVVNQFIRLNFGVEHEDAVYVKAQPLSDASIAYMRTIYSAILSNADGFLNEVVTLDIDAIRQRLEIPFIDAPAYNPAVPPTTDPTAPTPPDATTKAVSLNGAQVSSLQQIIINAQTMVYPIDTAKEISKIAFGLDDAAVTALFRSIVPKAPATPAPAP
jgi:hypothetical protein